MTELRHDLDRLDMDCQELTGRTLDHFLAALGRAVDEARAGGDAPPVDFSWLAFVGGGLESLRAASQGPKWRQWMIAFGMQPEFPLYRSLYRASRRSAREGRGDLWFVYKAPGMRLRMLDDDQILGQRMERQLARLGAGGVLSSWRAARYEPEVLTFGGTAGLELAHSYFTIDSPLWLRYHMEARSPADRWLAGLLAVEPLFQGAQLDGGEQRDVWRFIRDGTGRGLAADVPGEIQQVLRTEALRTLTQVDDGSVTLDKDIFREISSRRSRVLKVGASASELWESGALRLIGLREYLARLIIFTWNRAGLSGQSQTLLTELLAEAI